MGQEEKVYLYHSICDGGPTTAALVATAATAAISSEYQALAVSALAASDCSL